MDIIVSEPLLDWASSSSGILPELPVAGLVSYFETDYFA
jgi:hypothetical protein